MSVNPLKNCIPFDISGKFIDELIRVANDPDDVFHGDLKARRPVDPSGSQRHTSGIAAATASFDDEDEL